MKFYLIRHGIAEQLDENSRKIDLERKLTKRGKKKLKKFYKFLKNFINPPDMICSSTASRSVETAEIISKIWGVQKIYTYQELNPGTSLENYIHILNLNLNKEIIKEEYKIAIVSHEPDLSIFATALLNKNIIYDFDLGLMKNVNKNFFDPIVKFKKGAFMIVDWNGRGGILEICVSPLIV